MKSLRSIRYAAWAAVFLLAAILLAVLFQPQLGNFRQFGGVFEQLALLGDQLRGKTQRLAATSIGGPFRLTDQNRHHRYRSRLEGPPIGAVLWIHILSGRLPDDAFRNQWLA